MSSDNPQMPVDPDRPAGAVTPDKDDLPSDAGYGGEIVAGTEKDYGSPTAGSTASDGSADSVVEPSAQGDLQTGPAMDMHAAPDQLKIDGVVAQTRADFPAESDSAQFEHALRQRFDDIGIAVDDAEIRRLASS